MTRREIEELFSSDILQEAMQLPPEGALPAVTEPLARKIDAMAPRARAGFIAALPGVLRGAVCRCLLARVAEDRPATEPHSGETYLTLSEAARLLKVQPATARALLRAGDLPGRKLGKAWRCSRTQLEAFMTG